jgi:hypothetical protein
LVCNEDVEELAEACSFGGEVEPIMAFALESCYAILEEEVVVVEACPSCYRKE